MDQQHILPPRRPHHRRPTKATLLLLHRRPQDTLTHHHRQQEDIKATSVKATLLHPNPTTRSTTSNSTNTKIIHPSCEAGIILLSPFF